MKKSVHAAAVYLGIAVVLGAAMAMFMFASPNAAAGNENAPTLVLYDGPQTMTTSQMASIWAEGHPLFVYDVMVSHQHIWSADMEPSRTPMTYFDAEGAVLIEIEMPGLGRDIESAVILPSKHGITPTVENNRVSFMIPGPGFYTVIFNESVEQATHIFVNPLETDIPDRDDPNVIFIDPGHWKLDTIVVESGQTLYISGGAVVNSVIVIDNAADVTIRGRGIICGEPFERWNAHGSYARVPVGIRSSRNIFAEGIILINGNAWQFESFNSRDLYATNIKIISGRQNGDGFTFQSTRDHHVSNSFVRTWDDSLVIKNYAGSSRDILFENIQVWTDLAQSMEIGYETNRGRTIDPEISNVTFRDIFVLYNNHKPVISIHNSDDASVHNIRYENIIVDHAYMRGDHGHNNELIEFHMLKTHWSTITNEWGSIRDVTIDGLIVHNTLDGEVPNSNFWGHNAEHTLENVTMRNIYILGERVTTLEQLNANINDYAFNITIEYDGTHLAAVEDMLAAVPVAAVRDALDANITVVATPPQEQAEWPPTIHNPMEDRIPLPDTPNLAEGKPVTASSYVFAYVPANAVDGIATTYWESDGFPAVFTVDLHESYTIQTVAIGLNPSMMWEARQQAFEIQVSADGTNFTTIVPNAMHEFDPTTGNLVRVDFAPVTAIRVRLIFTANTAARTEGAQAAEIKVFE